VPEGCTHLALHPSQPWYNPLPISAVHELTNDGGSKDNLYLDISRLNRFFDRVLFWVWQPVRRWIKRMAGQTSIIRIGANETDLTPPGDQHAIARSIGVQHKYDGFADIYTTNLGHPADHSKISTLR
jgi:hypothetical protein